MYYILLPDQETRDKLMSRLDEHGMSAVFHYIPLHSAPAGIRYGRSHGSLDVTDLASRCILRLPLWMGMEEHEVDRVVNTVTEFFARDQGARRAKAQVAGRGS